MSQLRMSKNPPPPPAPPSSFWLPFIMSGLFGVLLGATLTYLALRSQLRAPVAPGAAPTAAMPVNPDPTTHLPTPDLTAGQTPAQADRTLGNFYYDHQNWSQAISHYESAIKLGSDDADIRTDLGNSYRFAGRPEDALTQYGLAQKMNPAHEFSLFNQGGLYLEDLKQPTKAIEVWQEYLKRFPTGQNAQAARQLIAQAQGSVTGLMLPPPETPAGATSSSATEDLILQQIKSAQTKTGKP